MQKSDPLVNETFRRAIAAFGGDDKRAREWMNTKHPELENRAPSDVVNKGDGVLLVRNLIARIAALNEVQPSE